MGRIEWEPGWEQALDTEVSKYLKTIAEDVLHDMQRTVPKNTGRLMNDLDYEVDGLIAYVGARSVDYAIYVERGTRPHDIKSKHGGLSWPGAQHPVNEVHHPGTTGTHFMSKALYKFRS